MNSEEKMSYIKVGKPSSYRVAFLLYAVGWKVAFWRKLERICPWEAYNVLVRLGQLQYLWIEVKQRLNLPDEY